MRRLLLALALVAVATPLYAIPIVGATSGVFANPTGPAGMVVSGTGTNQLTWGDPDGFGTGPNQIQFTGLGFNTTTEAVFQLGTFSYFNGTTVAGTEIYTADLDVTLAFTTPSGVNELFTFPITVISTPNGNVDPYADADILKLNTLYSAQTFTYNGVTYQAQLTGWQNATVTGGFITNGTEFHVFEGHTATADLYGTVTENVVPEPASLLLLGTGLVGAFRAARKRRG